MSKKEKLLERLLLKPKDFTYDELKTLLISLGFIENNRGKTSGSRVEFVNQNLNEKIQIHKPHPRNVLKTYQIKDAIEVLKKLGVIKDEE